MTKIEREKKIVECMIRLYCRKKEGNKELCNECAELISYAHNKLDKCKFGENKSSCKKCPIHCYKPIMREKIREIMRYSGPRMMFHQPIAAILHLMGK